MGEKNLFAPFQKGNISDLIVERVTNQIILGELRPGDKIPTEVEFCAGLAVSRSAVREAIKILEALGVVEIRRGEGTFVVNEYTPKLLTPMMYGLILSERNMTELLELNISILREIILLSLQRITEEEYSDLRRLYEELTEATLDPANDIDLMFELSTQFYNKLCTTTKNQLFIHVYDLLLHVFAFARHKGFENAVKGNQRKAHLNNYDLIMGLLSRKSDLTVDAVCAQILQSWHSTLVFAE